MSNWQTLEFHRISSLVSVAWNTVKMRRKIPFIIIYQFYGTVFFVLLELYNRNFMFFPSTIQTETIKIAGFSITVQSIIFLSCSITLNNPIIFSTFPLEFIEIYFTRKNYLFHIVVYYTFIIIFFFTLKILIWFIEVYVKLHLPELICSL